MTAPTVVLDASAVLAWIIDRVDPDEAQIAIRIQHALRSADAAVPQIWPSEIANGALVAERRGVCSPARVAEFFDLLQGLPIFIDGAQPYEVLPSILRLARLHSLTAYDAAYLELALRHSAQLATFDRRLAAAARQAGIHVFGDAE